MAVDAATVSARPSARAITLTATHALVGLVAASFALRFVLALAHATPHIFPDEYIYSAIARELAESGRPLVRGGAFFPAMLEPLLVAPFHLFEDPGLAYRLTQAAHALAMSLAAVPAFALARRIGLTSGASVAAAAIAVAVPDLVYVSFMLAEPVAYPLALAAVYAAVRALERPTWRAQVAFLTVSGLATFARLQYAALVVAFLLTALVIERRALRIPLAAVALTCVSAMIVDAERALGPYRGLADWQPAPGDLADWIGSHFLLLSWAAGVAFVPAAVAGIALALRRPRSRAERAFGVFTTALAALLVLEAVVIADFESARFEERYLFVLIPLIAVAAAAWVAHARPWRLAVAGGAAALVGLSLQVPVSAYVVASGKVDSPFLWAVAQLAEATSIGTASVIVVTWVAVAAGIGALAACARRPLVILVVPTLVAFLAVSVGASAYAQDYAADVRAQDLPADARWVDRFGFKDVALLQTPGGSRRSAMEQLFWNRSVRNILLLPGAAPLDSFGASRVQIGPDGTLAVGARPVTRPLLVQTRAVTAVLRGATRVARGGTFELWKPDGRVRLGLLVLGRYHDGWLARNGAVLVWPRTGDRTAGTLRLVLSMPPATQSTPLVVTGRRVHERVLIGPGERQVLVIRVDSCGPVALGFSTPRWGAVDTRQVSVRAEQPTFTPIQGAPGRCR